jgi:VWFA-related protein
MVKRIAPLAGMLAIAMAQTPAPTPQTPAQTQPPEEVIRINVNLVQVDALVTDAQGNLVEDLKAGDFEIRQDGKPQTITNFSYISTRPGQTGVRTAAIPAGGKKGVNNPAAPPPVPLRTNQVRRTFALVVDNLGLAAENIPTIRKALDKFVDQDMQPGDLAAVILTGSEMGALLQFTTDKRLLHDAINHIRYDSRSRVGVTSFAPAGSRGGMPAAAAAERRSEINAGSISAITNVVNGLKELPGRKTVVLFTEDLRIMAGMNVDPRAQEGLDRLADAASRASVVISSIDPRGLQTLQLTAADAPRNPRGASNIPQQRATQMFFSQDGMVRLAEATGGEFFHDTNDISGSLHRVVEDSNGYYLIGYHPAASTFDPKTGRALFHHVTVRVKRAGLQVRTRTGFLGNPEDLGPVARTPQAELIHAMTSPFASGAIHVQLTALFTSSATEGSAINALLHIDAKDLKFDDAPDDKHKAQVEILSATFTEDGQVQDQEDKGYSFALNGDQYQVALRSGLLYAIHHTVKKPGGYQMRVALRDTGSLEIGSASQFIEVPDLSKGHLALSSIELEEATGAGAPGSPARHDNPLGSPAVRSFLPGSEVVYACQILNPHLDANKQPQLEMEVRIFRDGVQINDSKPRPVEAREQADAGHPLASGELRLGPTMKPGDYVLQVIVTDKIAEEKYNVASQWMDFEVRQ